MCSNFTSFSFFTYSCHLRRTAKDWFDFPRGEELVLDFHKYEESVPVLHTCLQPCPLLLGLAHSGDIDIPLYKVLVYT